MKRRDFVRNGFAAAAAAVLGGPERRSSKDQGPVSKPKTAFKLKYAPSIGQFKVHAGDDPLAQVRFAAGEGFGPCSITA